MKLTSMRRRKSMRSLGLLITALVLLAVVIAIFVFFYLQRYMVYSADGAQLNKDATFGTAAIPEPTSTISPQLIYDDPIPEDELAAMAPVEMPELEKLNAVFVSYNELADIPALEARLKDMEYSSLVIQVKRDHGNLAWQSAIPGTAEYCEGTPDVLEFFKSQAEMGKYLVAKISCFRDDLFALDHQSEGLPITGGALWVDSDNYYWMSPESPSALNYIISIGTELKGYGFSELLLDSFSYLSSGNPSCIIYSSSTPKSTAISSGADLIRSSLSVVGMRVSIQCAASTCSSGANSGAGHNMSELVSRFDRIYVELDAGSNIGGVIDGLVMSSGGKVFMENWVVFITASNDTRFQEYGVAKVSE